MIYQRNYFFPVMTSCYAYEKLDPHVFLAFPFPSGNLLVNFSANTMLLFLFLNLIYMGVLS